MHGDDVAAFLEELPFARLLGVEVTGVGDDRADGQVETREALSRTRDDSRAHAGVVFTLAETTGAAAVLGQTDPPVFTVDMRIDHLAPPTGGLSATAEVLDRGAGVATVAVTVADDRGERVATATAVYAT